MFIFEVIGIPVPQKQTRFIQATGHAYNPSRKEAELLRWQIQPDCPECPLECAVELHLTFYMPIPKSASAKLKTQMRNAVVLPTKRPDVDNLAYLVTNALKGMVYVDDSQITDCVMRKRYSDRPRTVIKVIPIEELGKVGGDLCE